MSNNESSLSEKAKRIETALKFTDGDMEKAKQMASNAMSDITIIKGKFIVTDQDKSGFFLAYFNVIGEYIAAINSVVISDSSFFTRTRIFNDWKSHHKNIVAYKKGNDIVDSEKFNEDLMRSFIQKDVFPDVQKHNLDYLSAVIPDMIKESYGSDNVKCQIELEQTNSVELVMMHVDIMMPEREEPHGETSAEEPSSVSESKPVPDTAFGRKLADIESRAQYVVEGCCVLSPVKGKLISEINPGERIYVVLPAKDSVTQRILDAYKARNSEGAPLPVLGRIVEKVPNELTKGWVIFVLVAKGIYAKIVEEENMKIQTELTAVTTKIEKESEKDSGFKYLNWVLYGVFIILIIALVAIFSMM